MDDDDLLSEAIDKWIDNMVSSITSAAAEAYAAGSFHAAGQMQLGLSWDVVQHDAIEYMQEYRRKLVDEGILEVTIPVFDPDGRVTGHTTSEIPWLKGTSAAIKTEITDIIEGGIRDGKPTGIRVSKDGTYPDGSIAADLDAYCNQYRSQAATIARTETTRCYYNGEISRYADAGVRYVQYLGAPDACDECQPYIGQIFVLGSEPHLPLHPNCRCDYRPYYPEPGEIINCGDGNAYLHTTAHTIKI